MPVGNIFLGESLDPFDKMLHDLNSGDPEVNESKLASLKKACVCPQCPTFNKYAEDHGEILYCIIGKSDQPLKEELGCICADCPVAAEGGLLNNYYCTIGSEMEMRKNRRVPRGVRPERLY
jgi:hypothetical protein